jgi:hypothetical protein
MADQNVSSARKTLATEFFMRGHADVNSARQELLRMGIKTSYDTNVMIFSTLHSNKNVLSNAYAQESNGLVLEQKTSKPLVVPPRSLRFNIDTDASNRFLHQGLYHVYRVQDGTCFNLYHYHGSWVISTSKGYNMNNICWDGASYQQIVTECLEAIGLTWDTFTEQLDKTRCYSFGFKHPSFHKFFEGSDSPIYKIWFIQSVNLDENSSEYLWASDKTPIGIIEPQVTHMGPVNNLKELYKIASCALENFMANNEVNYGFILRSVNFEATGFHSDLFVESSLMRAIRRFWYENNLIDMCHKNKWPKEMAITLNAYLDSSTYEMFLLMFKQYTDTLASYSGIVQSVVLGMIELSKNRNADIAQTNSVAASMLQSFTDTTKHNLASKSDEEKRKIFTHYVCHPSSLELLMPMAMTTQTNQASQTIASQ